MDFSKEIFKGIKNILKQLHISLWDFLLLVDLTILFFAKNYKKSISFTINKTFLFKTYNFLYSWPLVTALMVIFILILLISITPEVSKFFGILEYPDNISRGYDQTIGASRFFTILIYFSHQLWIIIFSTLVLSGNFDFETLRSCNFIQILLLIFNSLYSIFMLVYSLFYVEYPTKHIGNSITLSADSQYLILKHHKDLIIIKNHKLDKPMYYLVKLNAFNSENGKIIDSSSTLTDIIYAFDNKAKLLDNPKDTVKGSEIPKSALKINHTDSMNYAKKNDEF